MDKSEAKDRYKQAKRPMGVYRIRNRQTDKSYVGFSTDLPARINRHKTELKFGSHRNAELLDAWKALGESSFEFEVLDELEHEEKTLADPSEELKLLAQMWIGKLEKLGGPVAAL